MAFSTQKDFFNVPFMNESYESNCKKACVKLKSYESTEDNRAWASDETKQSKFLSDLVTCEYRIGEGKGDFNNTDRQLVTTKDIKRNSNDISRSRSANTSGNGKSSTTQNANTDRQMVSNGVAKPSFVDILSPRSAHTNSYIGKTLSKQSAYNDSKNKEPLDAQLGYMTAGDSLLQCANVHLTEYQKLLQINTTIEKQLEVSNEHLKTANEENKKIREILANKLDSNAAKDFYNKIQKFTTAGKFNKNEENEMLQIYQKMENMNKSYEILQAENNYLRRLIEKLKTRITLESITIQPEQSNDIDYLQKEIDSLRKECLLLRQIEEDYQRSKQQPLNELAIISEQDAENIKAIIKERNSLREKCKSLNALEQQVKQLKYKTQEAKKEARELNSNLLNKTQYINEMEGEMEKMQKYYEERKQTSCLKEECLKAQLEDLKDELVKAQCEAQKVDVLAMKVSCLSNEVTKRDLAINEYDCQYKQLMDVVNELQSMKLHSLHDNQTQTCQEQTDELTFYTRATLEEIFKELKKRGSFDNESINIYGLEPAPDYTAGNEHEMHCCKEMEHLKQQINEMKKQMREEANCEDICRDALERLKELETLNSQLSKDNEDLTEKLQEDEEKLTNMLKKIEKLDKDINKNGQEAFKIGKDLEGTIGLVKDISDVQLKNQQLANAVSAINSRDDQKIIDDLRRQLEEELAKLNKCQQHNAKLLEEAKLSEMNLKDLGEFNNKLLAENSKLKGNVYTTLSEYEAEKAQKTDETKYKDTLEALEHSEKRIRTETKVNEGNFENTSSFHKDTTEIKDKQPPTLEKIKESKKETFNEKKHSTPTQQRSPDLKTTPSKVTASKQQKVIDFTDSDGFATSSSKETARNKSKVTQQKTKDKNLIQTSAPKETAEPQFKQNIPKTNQSDEQFGRDKRKDLALDAFVNKKSDTLKFNLQKGRCFEKEFRKILEEFILECSIYFSRLYNAKSKLYTICHKLCHSGIEILNFQELAYIHKKIYNQADKLLPGCLLDMILTEHRDQVEAILTSVLMPRLLQSKQLNIKTADCNICDEDQKGCCCKNELCCNNSDEMLNDKVSKLEKDISIAREYLESLRSIPLQDSLSTDNDDSTDTNNSTYRAASPILKQQKICHSKHVKKLKARIKKQTQI